MQAKIFNGNENSLDEPNIHIETAQIPQNI